jgi:AcrR family transcriptional regulator
MPTPARTSLDAITAAGGEILETRGLPGLTMQAVAQAVGVRAPSLYKHVIHRDALVGLVADAAATDLATHLAGQDGLAGLARSLRAWATAHPERFRLVFSGQGSPEVAAAAGAPLLKAARDRVGPAHKLSAARLVTAWATGFISMELAGAFQLSGDVDEAFEYGIGRLTEALHAG